MKRYLLIGLISIICGTISFVIYPVDTPSDSGKTGSTTKTEATTKATTTPEKQEGKNSQEIKESISGSIQPKEKKIKQKQPLGFFHTVNLYGVGELYISQADEADFTVEAEPKILPLINAYVKDQVLTIDMKNASEHSKAKISYYLKIKTLQAVNAYSDSKISIDGLETKVFKISLLSGFGEAQLKIDVTKLISKILGAGKMQVQGVADEQELDINGIGEFEGIQLKSKLATVNIDGSGIAKLNVADDLIVKIMGEGTVEYCGSPNIAKEISKNGKVTALDPNQCK